MLMQRPLAQGLGWARHSSSSEAGGIRQASGEAGRPESPKLASTSRAHVCLPACPLALNSPVYGGMGWGSPSVPVQPSPEPGWGLMPGGQMQAKVPMRFLHSMPRAWQSCSPSTHSSTSVGDHGSMVLMAQLQAVKIWTLPPSSGLPEREVLEALPSSHSSPNCPRLPGKSTGRGWSGLPQTPASPAHLRVSESV